MNKPGHGMNKLGHGMNKQEIEKKEDIVLGQTTVVTQHTHTHAYISLIS